MHDSAYDTNWLYRGNLTSTTGVNGTDTTSMSYDTTGIVVQTTGPTGSTVAVTTGASTNYSLPSVITPNSDSGMATSISYSSSFAVTQMVDGNGATASTSYDSLGRPASSTIPDGAQTTSQLRLLSGPRQHLARE